MSISMANNKISCCWPCNVLLFMEYADIWRYLGDIDDTNRKWPFETFFLHRSIKMDVRNFFYIGRLKWTFEAFFLHRSIKILIEISNGNANILATKKILSNLVNARISKFLGLRNLVPKMVLIQARKLPEVDTFRTDCLLTVKWHVFTTRDKRTNEESILDQKLLVFSRY